MVAIGVLHFVTPEPFTRIVPAWLPAARALVLISGVFEVLGGVGLLIPRVRRAASYGLVALYLAVFPANINMAVNQITLGEPIPVWALWARLPFQLVFIGLALWVGREDELAQRRVANQMTWRRPLPLPRARAVTSSTSKPAPPSLRVKAASGAADQIASRPPGRSAARASARPRGE